MTEHRVRSAALAAAAVMLLIGCARHAGTARDAADAEGYHNWSYVGTPFPPFKWAEIVNLAGARAKTAAGGGASVAIVATGVLAGHEDLPTVVPGEAACGPPSDTEDVNGHGTQLAGIVAGKDPGVSTRGMAPSATVIPIKVDCGVVSAPALTKGVDVAIARAPDVILIAIGGYPSPPPDVYVDLLDRISKHREILFVIASTWDGTHYTFPDWTTIDNALLVAAMTLDADERDISRLRDDMEIPYSARRGTIWAPGRAVATSGIEPIPGSKDHDQFLMHGTSPAAAIVAGCAALVKSKKKMDGPALKEALLRAAEPQPGLGPAPNNKRLNCANAVP